MTANPIGQNLTAIRNGSRIVNDQRKRRFARALPKARIEVFQSTSLRMEGMMPRNVAKMLAADPTIETLALETALDFLIEKAAKSSRKGAPADFITHRNIMILSLTIDLRSRGR